MFILRVDHSCRFVQPSSQDVSQWFESVSDISSSMGSVRELKRLASKQGCIQNGKRDKIGTPDSLLHNEHRGELKVGFEKKKKIESPFWDAIKVSSCPGEAGSLACVPR